MEDTGNKESMWNIFNEVLDSGVSKRDIDRLPPGTVYQGEIILQIVAAVGVVAKFIDESEYPVLCWCLKEESWVREGETRKVRRVAGMIIVDEEVGLECVDGPNCHLNFKEYLYL